jgi:hypothetical protein
MSTIKTLTLLRNAPEKKDDGWQQANSYRKHEIHKTKKRKPVKIPQIRTIKTAINSDCCGLMRVHGFFIACCRLYCLSCGRFEFFYSHFPVTSDTLDQITGTYFNKCKRVT